MLCCDDCSIGWAELLLPSDQLVCFDVRVSRLSLIRVRRVSNSTNKQLNTASHRFGTVPTDQLTTILTKPALLLYSALAPRQFKSQTAATLPSDSGDTFGVAIHAPLANVTCTFPPRHGPPCLSLLAAGPWHCDIKVATIQSFTHSLCSTLLVHSSTASTSTALLLARCT